MNISFNSAYLVYMVIGDNICDSNFSSSLSGKVLVDLTKQLWLSICIFIIIGEKIFPMTWEVIESLELYEIPVTSLTSDGAKENR